MRKRGTKEDGRDQVSRLRVDGAREEGMVEEPSFSDALVA